MRMSMFARTRAHIKAVFRRRLSRADLLSVAAPVVRTMPPTELRKLCDSSSGDGPRLIDIWRQDVITRLLQSLSESQTWKDQNRHCMFLIIKETEWCALHSI